MMENKNKTVTVSAKSNCLGVSEAFTCIAVAVPEAEYNRLKTLESELQQLKSAVDLDELSTISREGLINCIIGMENQVQRREQELQQERVNIQNLKHLLAETCEAEIHSEGCGVIAGGDCTCLTGKIMQVLAN